MFFFVLVWSYIFIYIYYFHNINNNDTSMWQQTDIVSRDFLLRLSLGFN